MATFKNITQKVLCAGWGTSQETKSEDGEE